MMDFGRSSIRFKFLLTVLATNLGTLIVAGSALVYNDAREYRQGLVNELTTQADILGQASASALEFNDPKFANENLALLRAKPEIVAAGIYAAKGSLFASYARTGAGGFPALPEQDGIRIHDKELLLFKRIVTQREIIGTVYLRARYDVLQRIIDYFGILGAVTLVSLMAGMLISTRLQTYISAPILSISNVAKQVMEKRDFTLRASKTTDDEIGYLVDAFNDMLAEIGRRAEAIEVSRQALEHEINERRDVQKALHTSERRNRSLVEAASSVIWVSDIMGNFVEPQPTWATYTGQQAGEYHELGWRSAFHAADQGMVDRAWALAINTPAPFELDARLWHAQSERYRQVCLRAVPLFGSDDEVIEWIGTVTDVDDRRAAEQEVRQLNAQLEQRVGDRTRQLEEVNKDLESFSYSVSHDLRAPVRAIGGFSAMLWQHHAENLSDEGRRLLGIVRSEASRMGTLIDDLLAFSRLGRQAMQLAPLNMKALAGATFERLCAQQQESQPKFQLGSLPECRGDRALITQVWVNLLSNAIKFSSKRPQALIEVGAISDDEKHTFFVRDNGTGFDPVYKAKLFGVFQRLHDAGDFPGTGVGLALVQRIINRHGGVVWADSQPDEGATFYFTLPKEASDGRV
ncbi:HAMP domain-containing protein [Chitinimonas arctica]|uniref:histidine kinase n=1 Tax=Chitinimonas arctica TaxID=2594795 RepID=A0A516SA26_9NEIS|nr:ATP-binding protein [Chitinimonas arctica]QDQ25004.1 HAMP domain-containing protein [Chitinimonas arctica]